jgi:LPS sulfotransferase NodH
VSKADLADCVSEAERTLLGQALSALRRERGRAWNAACDRAEAQGKRHPSLNAYGIDEIKRLARRFGTKAMHWTEC